ncbi:MULTISPECIES: hypothetical protein [unclassified Brevundimonas]|uniref:hypothetical protein n=1 Tax=unclassified Brevundimonas TaxID=2622653 RepID=UPI003F910444
MSSKPVKPLGASGLIALTVATMVLGLLGGVGSASLSELPGQTGLFLTVAVLALVMAATLWLCLLWWRRVDEAAREAHKWSWFWGGSCGMIVGAICLLTLSLRGSDIPLPASLGETPHDLLVSGMMAILAFQLIGYAIAWGWWWLARR